MRLFGRLGQLTGTVVSAVMTVVNSRLDCGI